MGTVWKSRIFNDPATVQSCGCWIKGIPLHFLQHYMTEQYTIAFHFAPDIIFHTTHLTHINLVSELPRSRAIGCKDGCTITIRIAIDKCYGLIQCVHIQHD
jgi:hypothetical protein